MSQTELGPKKLCECSLLSRVGGHLLTEHHPTCRRYNGEQEASTAIRALLYAMRYWGSQEDGIPDEAVEAYNKAAVLVGERMI